MKCPNCGGNNPNNESECIFCGSSLTKYEERRNTTEHSLYDRIVNQIKFGKNLVNSHGRNVWDTAVGSLKTHYLISELEDELCQMAADNEYCFSMNLNAELKNKVLVRIGNYLMAEEKVIYYYDNGVFSRAKEGICVTDHRVMILTKKEVHSFMYDFIEKIEKCSYGEGWTINSNTTFSLVGYGLGDEEMGKILAYVFAQVALNKHTSTILAIC